MLPMTKVVYVPAKVLPSFDSGIDHGSERIVVAEFPRLGTQLIWQKGCKRWKDRVCGYVYMSGNFEYQTVGYRCTANEGFNRDLTEGQWADCGLDESRPKLDQKNVIRMLTKISLLDERHSPIPYRVLEEKPVYKRGKTMTITWEKMEDLKKSLVSMGVI